METWRLLLAMTGILLVYAVMATFFGYGTTPVDVVMALVFGSIGLYVGNVLTDRLTSNRK